ncbi:hypothetical protein D3C81_1850910 [compost metagenome]
MKSSAAAFTRGRSALEPEAVTVPSTVAAGALVAAAEAAVLGATLAAVLAFGLSLAAEFSSLPPQPAKTPTIIIAERIKTNHFLDMFSLSSLVLSFCNPW